MPPKILETLIAALDAHEGDKAEIEAAQLWLYNYFTETYEETPEELAQLKTSIAISEAEEAKGYSITHSELKQKSLKRIANHFKKQEVNV